jgi:YHS domain-containing protein
MSDVSDLVSRIDGAISAVKDKAQKIAQQELQHFVEREKLAKEYEAARDTIIAAVKPRLEAFGKRLGERATPSLSKTETRRSVRFEFRSDKAYISLGLSLAPDRDLKNAVLEYDLKVVPVLWKFDSHAEFATPVAAPDLPGLTKWLDDRLVGFVELYIQIHESELYDKAKYVEDPVAKVKFPQFAAGATLDHGGQTYFFIDEHTRAEFAKQKGV